MVLKLTICLFASENKVRQRSKELPFSQLVNSETKSYACLAMTSNKVLP